MQNRNEALQRYGVETYTMLNCTDNGKMPIDDMRYPFARIVPSLSTIANQAAVRIDSIGELKQFGL